MTRNNIEVLISVAYRAGWGDARDGKDLPTLRELDAMAAAVYDRAVKDNPDGWRTDTPDKDDWYLTTYDGEVYGKAGERKVGMSCFEGGDWIEDKVYAWTPLPEPYMGEGKE